MLIDIHTHNPKTAEGTLAIRSFSITQWESHSCAPFSLGLHPWDSPQHDWFERLSLSAIHPQCLMIGECGIDHLRGDSVGIQKKRFTHQIQLSEDLHKPLIIHSVRAHSEILQIHKAINPHQPWIIHGYRGSLSMAQTLIERGIHLSFGPYLTQPKTTAIIKAIGQKNILLETDDNPIPITEVYASAAQLLGITTSELEHTIQQHFFALK